MSDIHGQMASPMTPTGVEPVRKEPAMDAPAPMTATAHEPVAVPPAMSATHADGARTEHLTRIEEKVARIEEKLARQEAVYGRAQDGLDRAAQRVEVAARSVDAAELAQEVANLRERVEQTPRFGALLLNTILTAVITTALVIAALRYVPNLLTR